MHDKIVVNTNRIIATISQINAEANKLIVDELKQHNLSGLAPSHGGILVFLYQHEEGVPISSVTAYIHKDKSTVTALVNKLEKMGLLEKFKHVSDSRSTMVKLTQKGMETKPIVLGVVSKKLLSKTYEGFEEAEKLLLCELLERVKNNFLNP